MGINGQLPQKPDFNPDFVVLHKNNTPKPFVFIMCIFYEIGKYWSTSLTCT